MDKAAEFEILKQTFKNAVVEEEQKKIENDAKIRLSRRTDLSYEQFKSYVKAAHLRPVKDGINKIYETKGHYLQYYEDNDGRKT